MTTQTAPGTQMDRSLGELFSELTQETGTLVRQEIALARTEMTQKAARFGKDAAFTAVGGLLAYAGLLALIAGVILGLWRAGLPLWGSALLVGAIVAGAGGALVLRGLGDMKKQGMAPQTTVQTLKEDVQWAKEQTR